MFLLGVLGPVPEVDAWGVSRLLAFYFGRVIGIGVRLGAGQIDGLGTLSYVYQRS